MGASHGDPPPPGGKEPSPHSLELGMLQPNRDGTGQRENFETTSSQAVPPWDTEVPSPCAREAAKTRRLHVPGRLLSWISPRKKTTGRGARESGCAGMPGLQPALLGTRDCPERARPRAGRGCPWGFWGAACVPRGFAVAAVPLSPVPERVRVLPRGSQGRGRSPHPAAACVGVCGVGRRGWTPPFSQPGELSQEIPAGPAGSWLSHFAGAE